MQASGGAVTRERPKKVVLPGLPWRQDIQALAVLSLVGIGVGAIFHQAALDDPYVTYRYASNLLRGDGFVYNPGEHILSTTAAGYALLLAVVGFPFPTLLPLISNVISILGIFSASVLLYAIAAWYGHRLAGLMAALLLELSPVLLASIGMETGVHASFIMAAFYLYFRGKLPWAAFFVVLAFLLRADAAIPAGLLFVHHLWTKRSFPLLCFVIFLVVAGGYLAYLTVTFGSPIPITLAAKTAQSDIRFPDYAATAGLITNGLLADSPLYWLGPLYLAVGAVVALVSARWALLILGWGLMHAVAYLVVAVAGYYWYYAPLVPGLALLCGLAVERAWLVARGLDTTTGLRLMPLAAAPLVLAVPLPLAEMATFQHFASTFPDARYEVYRSAGEWLNKNTPPDATVGLLEVGIVGYYADRYMIDFLGLTSRETSRALERDDIFWSVAHSQPDYLVLGTVNPLFNYGIEDNQWFRDSYTPVATFDNDRFVGKKLIVHQRVAPRSRFATERAADLNFGRMRLVRYASDKEEVEPGQYLVFSFVWEPLGKLSEKYNLFLHLVDEQGRRVSMGDRTVDGGKWNEGREVSIYQQLRIPEGTPPGDYYPRLGVQPLEGKPLLSLVKEGTRQVTSVSLEPIKVKSASSPPSMERLGLEQRVDQLLAEGLVLVGYSLHSKEGGAGHQIPLSLAWRATKPITADFGLNIGLLGSMGEVVEGRQVPLVSSSYPTTRWRPGEVLKTTWFIGIPPTEQDKLKLALSVTANGVVSSAFPLAEVKVQDREHNLDRPPAPAFDVQAVLQERAVLLGYDLSKRAVAPGETLTLTLYWRALAPSAVGHKVFTHLLDENYRQWAGHDGVPGDGAFPTAGWVKGEYLVDSHVMSLPDDAPPGEYIVEVGIYTEPNIERLPVLNGEGKTLGDNAHIGKVRVERKR